MQIFLPRSSPEKNIFLFRFQNNLRVSSSSAAIGLILGHDVLVVVPRPFSSFVYGQSASIDLFIGSVPFGIFKKLYHLFPVSFMLREQEVSGGGRLWEVTSLHFIEFFHQLAQICDVDKNYNE